MRFSLVDRILSIEPKKSITTIKSLSLAEEYLADHFPGFPVMPGVLMLESMVQASGWLMRYSEDFRFSTVLLKQAKAMKFNNFVTPGKSLTVNITVHEWGESQCVMKGKGNIEGKSAVSARLILEQFNLADKNLDLKNNDEKCTAAMKDLFHQLWSGELQGGE